MLSRIWVLRYFHRPLSSLPSTSKPNWWVQILGWQPGTGQERRSPLAVEVVAPGQLGTFCLLKQENFFYWRCSKRYKWGTPDTHFTGSSFPVTALDGIHLRYKMTWLILQEHASSLWLETGILDKQYIDLNKSDSHINTSKTQIRDKSSNTRCDLVSFFMQLPWKPKR